MTRLLALLFVLTATALPAQEETAAFDVGADRYRAGATLILRDEGTDDLFAAGETLLVEAPVAGDAHLAGRRIALTAPVEGDLYAAAMEVQAAGGVGGDATLFAYDVAVGPVGADLRAFGSVVSVAGPVGGSALLAAERLRVDGAVRGPVHLMAETVDWGPQARIDGPLVLYEQEPGTLEVPARVAPADRIERRTAAEWKAETEMLRPRIDWAGAVVSFLMGVLVLTALAALAAAAIPETLAAMRRRILARPFGTIWLGFLAESVLIGGGILFAVTLIGLLLTPAAILLAVLGGLAGYVVGVYAFGMRLMLALGQAEPQGVGRKALAAALGAALTGLIALIPLLGWLFVLALTLAGLGAIADRLFRPRFFATSSY